MKLEAINEKGTDAKKPKICLEVQKKKFEQKTGQSFNTFYKKYFPKLNYHLTGYCKDPDVALDLSSDAFIRALEKVDDYDSSKAHFSTWLFTIAKNITLQEMKIMNKTISIDKKIDEDGSSIKDFLNDSADEDLRENEISELVKRKGSIMKDSIAVLKQPYRNVIEMRELNNMSYKDIATTLGTDEDITITINTNDVIEYDEWDPNGMTNFGTKGAYIKKKETGVRLPFEIANVIEMIDNNGKSISNFKLIEGDKEKTPFFTLLSLPAGEYTMAVRKPQNLSTLKSQIRNGRKMLQKMVKQEFDMLDNLYL